jgi:large subunit ribosomal protein L19
MKKDYPEFSPGDMIKVYYKIREKDKVRLHPVEGLVIKVQGAMHRKSFTVRRLAYGQAYEVTFPYYSPNIEKIEMVKKSRRRPRRAKLYYLRGRIGKKAITA